MPGRVHDKDAELSWNRHYKNEALKVYNAAIIKAEKEFEEALELARNTFTEASTRALIAYEEATKERASDD